MNLWADFDNQQISNSETTARQKVSRRLTEQSMLSALRDWLLRDYAASYCRSLRGMSIYRRCYWIDALGFEPRSASSSQENAHSTRSPKTRQKAGNAMSALPPVLRPIAALSKTLLDECPAHPLTLHGMLLAAKHKGKASPETESFVLPKESSVVSASWAKMAPTLLKGIEQSPAIFLLNPFGQTLYSLDQLAPVYQRTTAPTELCLLIPQKLVEAHLLAAFRAVDTASTLTAMLRSDRWKMLLAKQAEALPSVSGNASIAEGLIELLAASIRKHFLFVQRIALTMCLRPTLVETVPYTLLFATRRKDSLMHMNDAVCRQRRHVEEESYRGVLGEAWFAAQRQERTAQEMQQLYLEIVQRGRSGRIRRWPDFRQQLLLDHFGQISVAEYDDILLQLLREGAVRCEWGQKREIAQKKVPSYETVPGTIDVLLWR
jgi:hypothetical protein